jgi:hypothetical protein
MLFSPAIVDAKMDYTQAALWATTPFLSMCSPQVGTCRPRTDEDDHRKKRLKLDSARCRADTPADAGRSKSYPGKVTVRLVSCVPAVPTKSYCYQEGPCATEHMDVDTTGAADSHCDASPRPKSWNPCNEQLCSRPADYCHRRLKLGYVDEVDLKLEQLFTTYQLQQQQQLSLNQRFQPREAAIAEDDDVYTQMSRSGFSCQSAHHSSSLAYANCHPPICSNAPGFWPAFA